MESSGSSHATRGRDLGLFLAPPLLFLFALALRALSLPLVYDGRGGVYFFGNDAYYHARRIVHAIAHFPAYLQRDPYQNYPFGGEPIWPPTFDWLAALAARIFVDTSNLEAIERFLVWIPPVLGAATVVLLYFLVRRFAGNVAAWAAGLLLAILPAHSWYSQLAFVDHHVATALMTTLLLAAGMLFAAKEGDGPEHDEGEDPPQPTGEEARELGLEVCHGWESTGKRFHSSQHHGSAHAEISLLELMRGVGDLSGSPESRRLSLEWPLTPCPQSSSNSHEPFYLLERRLRPPG